SPVRISVLDAAGKTVYSRSLGLMETGAHQFTLSLSEYSKGCYWVDIQTAKGVKTSQLVVVK
ncbi:MAG TPA: T9SS type A sorting domain-containing protein, partial [Saprospiraceae bacterium]|nr:T9SS type A sorting domain-containing protein [Saprospiraceae bacterium]